MRASFCCAFFLVGKIGFLVLVLVRAQQNESNTNRDCPYKTGGLMCSSHCSCGATAK